MNNNSYNTHPDQPDSLMRFLQSGGETYVPWGK